MVIHHCDDQIIELKTLQEIINYFGPDEDKEDKDKNKTKKIKS
jgi:hypothetical protein